MIKNNWLIIEQIKNDPDILNNGLETLDKIKRQLDVDLPRLNIFLDNNKIYKKEQILYNNIDFLRCCTQSVFFIPLNFLIEKFDNKYYIVHTRKKK